MATNCVLDDQLICEAMKIGGHKTKESAVTAALEEYVKQRKQLKIRELFNSIDFEPDTNYKEQRKTK